MKFIREKKLNDILVIVILYFSFCLSNWFTSRGTASLSSLMGMSGVTSVLTGNEIVAFLMGGLIPTLLYELITRMLFKMGQVKIGGGADDMRYVLRFFYIAANIVIFLVKLTYLINPLISIYGDIFISFIITTAFMVWYFLYVAKHYLEKDRYAMVLYQLGGAYLILSVITSVLPLIMGVFL